MDDARADLDDRIGPRSLPPAHDERRWHTAIAGALIGILALGAGGWYWWTTLRQSAPPVPVATPTPGAVADPAPGAASEPAIRHPIEAVAGEPQDAGARGAAESREVALQRALVEWLGSKPVASMLQTDEFVRRVVTTVDNLGRDHAAPALWPVVPSQGRFTVQRSGDAERIAPANTARYDAFVAFATSIDVARAAALYRSFYPLFQLAYQDLGYPRSYFNDRLVDVIDLLLAAPEPAAPPAVRLTEVKGPIPSTRPWVRYEFVDPAFEELPAGSKMLIRVGLAHERALKTQLRAFRARIAQF